MILIYITCAPAGLPPASRRAWEHKTGRALLRIALAQRGFQAPDDLESILLYGPRGKPYIDSPDFHFNISHSGGFAACAVERYPVGLDMERRRNFSPALAKRICTPEEAALTGASPDRDSALTQLWTCKESLMKLTGQGMAELGEAVFLRLGERPESRRQGVRFQSVELDGYWITEACEGDFTLKLEWVNLAE